MDKQRRVNPKIISLIVIVLVAGASTAVYAVNNANKNGSQPAETSQTTSSSNTATTETADDTTATTTNGSASYKSGTYTETGSYSTPGGIESVTVTATLASDGTVTDVSTTGSADRGDSAEYQEQFLSAYKQYIVGKKIDAVSLSRVSGSSLTSNGFNRALSSIKADAEA